LKGEVMPFSILNFRLGITDDIRVRSYSTVPLIFETGIRRN
jgi:hypothetical protein